MFKSKYNTNLSGKKLPPVGSNVKIIDDGSLIYGSGESGEVVAHVENTAVVRMSYGLGCFKAHVLELIDESEKDIDSLTAKFCALILSDETCNKHRNSMEESVAMRAVIDCAIKAGWRPNAPQRTETKESRQDLFDRAISDVSDRGKFELASLDLSMKIEKLIDAGWRPTKTTYSVTDLDENTDYDTFEPFDFTEEGASK